jgi:hypothetical protein
MGNRNRQFTFKVGINLFFGWFVPAYHVDFLRLTHSLSYLFPIVPFPSFVMGKGWVRTHEQEEYLDSEFNSYLKARKNGKVKIWRTKLHDKWEERWPERQFLINEWKLTDDAPFNTAQMAALGEALAARKTVICIYLSQ